MRECLNGRLWRREYIGGLTLDSILMQNMICNGWDEVLQRHDGTWAPPWEARFTPEPTPDNDCPHDSWYDALNWWWENL